MRAVLISWVVLVYMYPYTEACSCLRQHPQEKFCGADFVIKATILGKTLTGPTQAGDVIYTVRIIEDYKNQNKISTYQNRQIYTALHSATCGSYFEIGREYIISGSNRNGKWRTGLCNINARTTLLTSYQKEAYKSGYYKKGCTCEIKECVNDQCPPPAPNTCVIKQNADFQCFYQQNSCRREPYGCAWHSPACH